MIQSNQKMQFLDPFGGCMKIILLNFYPQGTKLRINDHKILISEENIMEKMIWRKYYGDSRDDMHILFPMIIRMIELYIPQEVKNKKSSENLFMQCKTSLIKLMEYTIKGIHQLQQTYNNDNVIFVLQYYVILIEHAINNEYSRKLLPPHIIKNLDENLLDIDKIKNIWTVEQIQELEEELTKCFMSFNKKENEMGQASLKKINSILESQEEKFYETLKSTNVF